MRCGAGICKRLQFSPRLLELALDVERDTTAAVPTLSLSDRKLVHLARALVYDAEVLVVQQPTLYCSAEQGGKVMESARACSCYAS